MKKDSSLRSNNLTGSGVGRKNWAAAFGMTFGWSGCGGDRGSQNRHSNSKAKAKRDPSAAQANHPTGSWMGRKKMACSGRDDRFVVWAMGEKSKATNCDTAA